MKETGLEPLSSEIIEYELQVTTGHPLVALAVFRALEEGRAVYLDRATIQGREHALLFMPKPMHSSTAIEQTSSEPRST